MLGAILGESVNRSHERHIRVLLTMGGTKQKGFFIGAIWEAQLHARRLPNLLGVERLRPRGREISHCHLKVGYSQFGC